MVSMVFRVAALAAQHSSVEGSFLEQRPTKVATVPILRISASLATATGVSCPAARRAKARISQRISRPWRQREYLEHFLLDPLFAVLDAVEHDSARIGQAFEAALEPWGDRLGVPERRWIMNAAFLYPDFRGMGLQAVRGWWVVKANGQSETRELYTWGRGYVDAADTRRRVLVLPTFSSPETRSPDQVKIAVAAYTTGWGRIAEKPRPWGKPFASADTSIEPDEVTVLGVGLENGAIKELWRGSPAAAKGRYESFGRPAITAALGPASAIPGHDCSGCKRLDSCTTIPTLPEILGVHGPDRPLREVSATSLRYYQTCPRQHRLSRINVRGTDEETAATRTGRLVDAKLNALHTMARDCGCALGELRGPLGNPEADIGLEPIERERADRLLAGHRHTCPWNSACVITDVQAQATVVAFDPNASAVIYAKPDLLYREDGALVWRETATSTAPPSSRRSLFDTWKRIQLALALLLCEAGVFGVDNPVARVEVEYLTDRGPDIRYLECGSESNIDAARKVLASVVPLWFNDDRFAPSPGPACIPCPYRRWCPESVQGGGR